MERSKFYQELVGTLEGQLSPESEAVLAALNPRTPAQLSSILRSFPTLGREGLIDIPFVDDVCARLGGAELASFRERADDRTADGRHVFAMGASAPQDTRLPDGWVVPTPPAATLGVDVDNASLGAEEIDLRHCTPWPPRDQGRRGSCVAFAATALREALDCETTGSITDLSEQFLYWAIKTKTNDPRPTEDGTLLEFARDALEHEGICTELSWLYDPNPITGNPGHAGGPDPSPGAITEAAQRAHAAADYQRTTTMQGHAARVLEALETGRPVAISLPVFADPLSGDNNWNTDTGQLFGEVIDPVPTSHRDGGHAVCVTGYVPDATEPMGGYFVIRNSWGTMEWGSDLPDPDFHGPEAGYGQVSASYVDRYLWELLRL